MVAMFRAPQGRWRRWLLVIGVGLVLGVWTTPAAAQSTLGTIRGTVRDPQNTAVASAAVLVTDEDTGVPRTAETDTAGNFEVPNLRAGSYRVEINAAGFKAYQQSNVTLRAGEIVRADAALSVGDRTFKKRALEFLREHPL